MRTSKSVPGEKGLDFLPPRCILVIWVIPREILNCWCSAVNFWSFGISPVILLRQSLVSSETRRHNHVRGYFFDPHIEFQWQFWNTNLCSNWLIFCRGNLMPHQKTKWKWKKKTIFMMRQNKKTNNKKGILYSELIPLTRDVTCFRET